VFIKGSTTGYSGTTGTGATVIPIAINIRQSTAKCC
jgi:hypothetical protein